MQLLLQSTIPVVAEDLHMHTVAVEVTTGLIHDELSTCSRKLANSRVAAQTPEAALLRVFMLDPQHVEGEKVIGSV